MSMNTVAGVGRDGGGIGIELGLGEADGGVGGWRGDGGNRRIDGIGKRGGDGCSGEGGKFLHGGRDTVKKKLSTSIDELEKSDRTVLKPMKLISYESV